MSNKDKKYLQKYDLTGCIPSPPDERDYTAETVALAEAPRPETYIQTGMTVLNQGSIGSCVAHACATALGYGEKTGGKTPHDFSRGFIYGNRRSTDHQGEGMYIRQALKQLNHCGDCEQKVFPYNETYPKVKARIEKNKENLLKQAEPFKILNYFRCYSNDEVKRALLNQGAVVISIPVYESFAGDCPIPGIGEKMNGHHAMCVVGWDKTGWLIQNSWSKGWGNKGNLHLPYNYPINEFWGVTIDPNYPEPKKDNVLTRIVNAIGRLFNLLFSRK